MTPLENAKNTASLKALEFVEEGMRLGLGTGSTATYFIDHLIKKCKSGFKIQAAATSTATEKMAKAGGIPLLNLQTLTSLDLTIDGADEIDSQKRLIKGGGGAFIREKILAHMSKEMIVIADYTKLVAQLGKHPLPVEIIPFGAEATKSQLAQKGYIGKWRKNPDQTPYITDNGNWIIDIHFTSPLSHPEKIELELLQNPGVVQTGFFFNLAKRIVIGREDGSVKVIV